MSTDRLHINTFRYDDDIIAAMRHDRKPRLQIYRLSGTAVVLGRGSVPEKELHIKACISDRVPLLKRHGGGCAVVLDPGNVIVSAVLPVKGLGGHRLHFERMTRWLIEGLRQAGVEGVAHEGISDLAVDGRKIGGACIYHPKNLLYYSATLVVVPDMAKVERYLRYPPREPAYRQSRTHRDFMMALAPSLWPGSAEQLAFALKKNLQADPIDPLC